MNNSLLNKKEITEVLDVLKETYPAPKCGLNYSTPFELMLSLILAAQCTDERVNIVRPQLTLNYPTPQDILNAGQSKVYDIIKSISFPNNKSKHIIQACNVIISKFNSAVPNTMEELVTIPGIGRKSANIILSECFGKVEGIAVDTHVTRLSRKIGFTKSTSVTSIEKDLMRKLPKDLWGSINHILVTHGKTICNARKPLCSKCCIYNYCKNKE